MDTLDNEHGAYCIMMGVVREQNERWTKNNKLDISTWQVLHTAWDPTVRVTGRPTVPILHGQIETCTGLR